MRGSCGKRHDQGGVLNSEIVGRLEASLRPSPVRSAAEWTRLALSISREGQMRKRWVGVGLAATLLVTMAAILGLVTQSSSRSTVKIHAFSKGDPDAVAAVKNSKAAVGPNESRSSDATAEAQEAFWRAYPASVNTSLSRRR